MKKILFVIFGLLASNFAHAQFGGLLSAASSAVGGGGGASLEQITGSYIVGSKQIYSAQDKLMKAANIKLDKDVNTAAIASLTPSATSEQVEATNSVITAQATAIQNAYANQNLKLDANGKKLFMSGFADFAVGVLAYGKLALSVKGFRPGVSDVAAAGTALAIAKNVPDDMGNLKSTFTSIYSYAKTNNISPPSDSAEVTKMLGDF